MMHVQSLAVVLALTLAVVTSTAVMPVVPISEMAPEHACFFMCNICFHSEMTEMMDCANNLCGALLSCGPERDAAMLLMGHRCVHFPELLAAMAPPAAPNAKATN